MYKERLFFRNHLLGSSCQRIWIKNYKRRFVPSQTEQEAKTFQSLIVDLVETLNTKQYRNSNDRNRKFKTKNLPQRDTEKIQLKSKK